MNILLLLIPVSLLLLLAAMLAFVWALRAGQFEDMDTPALDVLVEPVLLPSPLLLGRGAGGEGAFSSQSALSGPPAQLPGVRARAPHAAQACQLSPPDPSPASRERVAKHAP